MKSRNRLYFALILTLTIFCSSNNLMAQELTAFTDNGKYGLKNSKGEVIVQPIYNSIDEFSEGLAAVTLGEGLEIKSGFIDKAGKVVVEIRYDDVKNFSEGLAVVALRDSENELRYGFINKTGKIIIACQYENAKSFENGKAIVFVYQGVFVIDKIGNIIRE